MTDSVDTIIELSNIITGAPYEIGGDGFGSGTTTPTGTYTAVGTIDGASEFDQIALTRDSNPGVVVFEDPSGTIQIFDSATQRTGASTHTIGPDDYSAIDQQFDMSHIINVLDLYYFEKVKNGKTATRKVRHNVVFKNSASIAKYGQFKKSHHINKKADFSDYADKVFSRNADPQQVPNSVTIPMISASDLLPGYEDGHYVGNKVDVVLPDGVTTYTCRIARIEHNITPTTWVVQVFLRDQNLIQKARPPHALTSEVSNNPDGTVLTNHLDDKAVTTAKIDDAAVGSGQLANGAVTAAKTAFIVNDIGGHKFTVSGSTPSSPSVGDIWSDTGNGNVLKTWNGSAWTSIQDAAIATAQSSASSALTVANGKNTTFIQSTTPTANAVNDQWIDTGNGNVLKVWSGSAWVNRQDAAIATAQSAATTAQTTANGKNTTFIQSTTPTANAVNDQWIDTGNGNLLKTWSGTSWVSRQDAAISTAQSAATTAQTTANGKNKIFVQGTTPTATAVGDQWIDTANGNVIKIWDGSTWVNRQDTAIATAQSAANTAQSTANGKNKVTYSTSSPGTTANVAGDLWFRTSGATVIEQWQGNGGTSWTQVTLTNAVISTLDAGKITTGSLAAARIAAGTITGTMMAANTVTASQIAADTITASQIASGAITASELAAGSVTAAAIAANTITASQIASDTITASQIAAGAVTSSELASNSVVAGKIAAGTVTTTEIAADTIVAGNIAAGAVTASELAANSVTAAAIAAGTITADKMLIGVGLNAVANAGFETNALAPHVMLGGAAGAVGATVHAGTKALQITCPTISSTPTEVLRANGASGTMGLHLPVKNGDTIHAEVWARTGTVTGSPSGTIYVTTYNAAGTTLTSHGGSLTTLTSAYQKLATDYTITDATAAYAVLTFAAANTTSGNTLWVDDMVLATRVDGTLIVDGAITAGKIAAGAIDAMTITGPIIQTDSSGNRLVIRDDGSEGTIDFYSGVTGETHGYINPGVTGSTHYLQIVTSRGPTAPFNTSSSIVLQGGSTSFPLGYISFACTGADFGVADLSSGTVNTTGVIFAGGSIQTNGGVSASGTVDANKVIIENPGSSTSAANLRYNSGGSKEVLLTTSLSKFKLEQQTLTIEDVRGVLDLTPKTWFDRHQVEQNGGKTKGLRRVPGLVAEDVESHAPTFAEYDGEGHLQGVAYDRIAAALIPIVRDQQQRIEALENRLNQLLGDS